MMFLLVISWEVQQVRLMSGSVCAISEFVAVAVRCLTSPLYGYIIYEAATCCQR
jgi:hypothetical protein